jgi:hypothetical protein
MKQTILKKLNPVLLGLACACAAGVSISAQAQRVPTGTNQIAFADFDNFIPGGNYGYWYSGPVDVSGGAPQYFDRFYADPVIDPAKGPTVGRFTFDATQFQGTDAVLTGWWGCGFGGQVNWTTNVDGISIPDPALFISMDPVDYILSFDARIEGLEPGQSANCDMEFRIGTGGGSGWVLVKQIRYHPGSNWTHFVFTLDDGTWIGADSSPTTSLDSFTNAIAAGTINTIAWNQNQPNPSQFGFDGDNAIYLDNVKLDVLQYAGPPPPPPPKVALPVFDYNFDDKGLWWAWPNFPATTSGWSANANLATYSAINPAVGEGVNGSQAFAISMDNTTILTDPPGQPAWAGGNASAGGPVNYAYMTSGDLKDYRLNFAARAVGLADDQGSTPFVFQIYFNAPDDTLSPADGDANRDTLLRLNVTVNGVTTNWQTFKPSLKEGSVDSGSLANFQTFLSKIDEITFQLQIQNPHQSAVWGLDAGNEIVVDDLKLERLVTGTPPLKIEPMGDKVVVSWDQPSSGTVKLLSGSTPAAITTEVVGATSPYTNAVSAAPKYFRTQWVAP